MTPAEINEAVARKLGWAIDKTSDHIPWYGKPNGHPLSAMIRELPAYSTSIEAAWEIVEHWLKSDRLRSFELRKNNASSWYALFTESFSEDAIADTAPLAICKAFLKLDAK